MNAWTNIILKQKHMEKRRIKSENIKENGFNCVIVAEKRKSSTITTFKNQDNNTKKSNSHSNATDKMTKCFW